MKKTYTELIAIPDYFSRLEYLQLHGKIGDLNQEVNRYLNQKFYRTPEWRRVRDYIIVRDGGWDLGCEGLTIIGKPVIHHLNPVSLDDVLNRSECLFDPENLILTSYETHNLIHYGHGQKREDAEPVERKPGDTCPWK